MMFLKTKLGTIICSVSDFKSFMISKGILLRGEIIKDGRWKRFYSNGTQKVHKLHEDWWLAREVSFFNLFWKDVIDWYDYDSFLYRNAEELIKLIDEGKLKVYDSNITKIHNEEKK